MNRGALARAILPGLLISSIVAPVNADPPSPPPLMAVGHGAVASRSVRHDRSPALRDIAPLPPTAGPKFRERRLARLGNLRFPRGPADLDPAVQSSPGATSTPLIDTSWEGVSSDAQAGIVGVVLPPDTNMDVGPSHIVQWVNLTFAVYDKSGALLYGPASGNTLWQGFGGACETSNDGDPIVLYDHLADRWFMSQLAIPNFPNGPFWQCIAVSTSPDPLGLYYRYAFAIHETKLNDYPKFGVWPDGYYLAVNQFQCSDLFPPFGFYACDWAGQRALAFERDKMLLGQPAQTVAFELPLSNRGGMLPADLDGPGPPPGTPNYFVQVDDGKWFSPAVADRLQIWPFHVDWANPASSTFGPNPPGSDVGIEVTTAPFDSDMCGYAPNCIPQPGVDILGLPSPPVDALSDRLMYRLQYRYFGTHETLVVNHTVDVDGTDRAGIRWYELRNGGSAWSMHQQGTYAPADGLHRWMGSVAMDAAGNMALGFSVSSLITSPSIRYVGREATDLLNQMGLETTIIAGTGYQLHSSGRWGDYSTMSVDPTDDCTFWYTQEYYANVDILYGANWQTRIASFKFPSCGSAPPAPSVLISDAAVTEGNSGTVSAVFTVSLSAASTQTISLDYATADDTATAGSDYVASSGTLSFPAGTTSQTLAIVVNGDTSLEANETFLVNLSNATNATVADGQGVGTIQNDDAALTVLAPNGGESWPRNSTQTIQWNSMGLGGNVKIDLSRDGGVTWPTTLFGSVPNDGAQDWRVFGRATTTARIRVCSVENPSVCDVSDGNFAIAK
jgi:hypothetical protein